MKLHRNNKIEAVAYKGKDRIGISAPWLVGDKLVATNGKNMVVLPIEREDGDVDGYVLTRVFPAARKAAKGREVSIVANDDYRLADGSSIPRDAELTKITPCKYEYVVPREPPTFKIMINAASLAAIAAALDSESVILEISDERSPITIRPGYHTADGRRCHETRKGFGVMMPVGQP